MSELKCKIELPEIISLILTHYTLLHVGEYRLILGMKANEIQGESKYMKIETHRDLTV